MVIGYLDIGGKNIAVEKQRRVIEQYAADNDFAVDMYVSETDIRNMEAGFQTTGHTVLCANVASLGNSLAVIVENLKAFLGKGLNLVCVKEKLVLKPSSETDLLLKGLALSIEIRNSMVSTITKNSLDEKKASGCKLGRCLGSKNKKRVWDGKKELIVSRLLSGVSRKRAAQEAGISVVSLYNFLAQIPKSDVCCRVKMPKTATILNIREVRQFG